WADANMKSDEERELFAVWIRDHPDQFKVIPIVHEGADLSHLNWCVDTPEDLTAVREIFDALYKPGACFGFRDVLAFLSEKQSG
ncbi:MAG: spore coat protein, partial [Alphaproteobacteria bacterium]|nr:spore coat protein [Alphaproteobacteria bacterium]